MYFGYFVITLINNCDTVLFWMCIIEKHWVVKFSQSAQITIDKYIKSWRYS